MKLFLGQFFKDANDEKESSFTSTSHTLNLISGPISYQVITGLLPQYLDDGENTGHLFFTAYLKEDAEPNRPLTFIFNGGPGGSSMAMHIGGFGPRRLLLPEEGQKTLPPYEMIDNPETIFDVSDLIFIDPIGTGYSEVQKKEYKHSYYSVEGDLVSFTEFIRMFCIHFDRWNSPKYLIGASYGTMRAVGLAESLANRGIYLNGIVLMSSVFDYHFSIQQRDLPFSNWLNIPSFAATAWYHKRSMHDQSLEEVLDYARRFIYEQYAPHMLQPNRLSPAEQLTFYQNLADLIGLPLATIRRYEGRIGEGTFVTEFFATDRKVLGGIDSRYVGDVSSLASEYSEDPSYRDLRPAFYPSFLHYLQTELDTKKDSPYIPFSQEAFFSWNWATFDSVNLPSFLQRLRRTLVANPHMKVFIGSGYYDLR
ncbi:MAG TPA: hypothetical protein VHL30_04740, partial [Chlamydiales bacterium]|nr:hypothetical protein [Chlamydiales bacterium]